MFAAAQKLNMVITISDANGDVCGAYTAVIIAAYNDRAHLLAHVKKHKKYSQRFLIPFDTELIIL